MERLDKLLRSIWQDDKEKRNGTLEILDREFPKWKQHMVIPYMANNQIDLYIIRRYDEIVDSWANNAETVVIDEGFSCLSNAFFSNCKNLKVVYLPTSLKKISYNAFYNCENLETIYIPKNITVIEDSAFHSCKNLKFISLPEGINSLKDSLFYGCASLATIIIPESVSQIEGHAFFWCRNLERVYIPDSVKSVGDYAFYHCDNLKEVSAPGHIMWGKDVFNYCGKIRFEFRSPIDFTIYLDESLLAHGFGKDYTFTVDEFAYIAVFQSKKYREMVYRMATDICAVYDRAVQIISEKNLHLNMRQKRNLDMLRQRIEEMKKLN